MCRLACFSLFVFLLPPFCVSQGGFSKTYDLGGKAAAFTNCTVINDTLVMTGVFLPDSSPWNALLVRMDTLGNLINFHQYQDSLGDFFSQSLNVDVIKTTDGGFMITGSLIYTNNGVIIKTSSDGNLEFYKKYPDDKYFSPRKILELPDGYMVLGIRQRSNFKLDAYLMKIDKQGEIVWEEYLGDWELDETAESLVMLDSNHFMVGGSSSNISSVPNMTQVQARSKFWFVSPGNPQWTWQSPLNTEWGVFGLQHLPDGGWLYCTRTFLAFGPQDWGGLCKIVRRDSNMNLVWQRTLMPQPALTGEANNLWDIKPTPDGNWVAVGHWVPYYSENPDSLPWQGGFLHKFSPDGDSLWVVLDSAFWHPEWGLDNRLGGAAVLPSGSVVAVGYANSFDGADFKSWAWVLKVDKDGCVDTLCTVVGSDEAPPLTKEYMTVQVFPNPAGNWVRFQWPALFFSGTLTITDATGRALLRSSLPTGQTTFEWDTAKIASGVYFYRLQAEEGIVASGKILVSH